LGLYGWHDEVKGQRKGKGMVEGCEKRSGVTLSFQVSAYVVRYINRHTFLHTVSPSFLSFEYLLPLQNLLTPLSLSLSNF